MDTRLSIILLFAYLYETISAAARCPSYTCGTLSKGDCARREIDLELNLNWTMKSCDSKTDYCPWGSLSPDTNSTANCTAADIKVQK